MRAFACSIGPSGRHDVFDQSRHRSSDLLYLIFEIAIVPHSRLQGRKAKVQLLEVDVDRLPKAGV